MSHFTVMVFGEDVEGQLAPYDENLRVEPYREYMTDEEAARFESHYKVSLTADLDTVLELLNQWWGRGAGYDAERDEYYRETTYNPDSKWDWYSVGGRWRGYFRLKKGVNRAVVAVGEPGVFDNAPMQPGGVDECLKGMVDVEAMRDEAGREAGEHWDRVDAIVRDLPAAVSWESLVERTRDGELTIDQVREAYHAQARVRALREACDSDHSDWLRWVNVEDFQVSRDEYVQEARDSALTPYAYVQDGVWHAPGEMGWWAMSTDTTDDRKRFSREFNQAFDALPDDCRVTLVDCHI